MVFRQCARFVVVVVLALTIFSCANYGERFLEPDGSEGQDGSEQTDNVGVFACNGVAKLELAGELFENVKVTSERLLMGCCEGAILRFHLAAELGFDVRVTIRSFDYGDLLPGEYSLQQDEIGAVYPQVLVSAQVLDSSAEHHPMVGSLLIESEDVYDDPVTFTLCARVEQEGALSGLRIWVEKFPLMPDGWWERFGIYLLADADIRADQAAQLPLDSLVLEDPAPLVHLGTLSYYDGVTHALHIGGIRQGTDYIFNHLPEVGVYGLPFVVMVNGERIYLGAFYTMVSSLTFDHPVIIINYPEPDSDCLTIHRNYAEDPPPGTPDPRTDSRLFDLLEAAGKLKL